MGKLICYLKLVSKQETNLKKRKEKESSMFSVSPVTTVTQRVQVLDKSYCLFVKVFQLVPVNYTQK